MQAPCGWRQRLHSKRRRALLTCSTAHTTYWDPCYTFMDDLWTTPALVRFTVRLEADAAGVQDALAPAQCLQRGRCRGPGQQCWALKYVLKPSEHSIAVPTCSMPSMRPVSGSRPTASGAHNAQARCAQRPQEVPFRAPPATGHRQHGGGDRRPANAKNAWHMRGSAYPMMPAWL